MSEVLSWLTFVMVALIFVHTFLNSVLAVAHAASAKLSGVGASVTHGFSSVEHFFGTVVATVAGWFKKKS